MKKLIALAAVILPIWLFCGYYETRWIEDDKQVFFVKKSPTFKFGFINVFLSDHPDNWHGELEGEERQYAIDFANISSGLKPR
jgi:hypothetical protein